MILFKHLVTTKYKTLVFHITLLKEYFQYSRSREQLRFDTNRIVAILKEHEKILVDGFDQNRFCKIKKRRASFGMNSLQSTKSNANQTIRMNLTQSSLMPPITTTSSSPTFDEPTSEANYLLLVEKTTPRSHSNEPYLDPTLASPSSVTEREPDVSTPLQINLEFRNEEYLSDISKAAQVKTCEDLLKAGFLDNKVYTVEIPPDSHNQREQLQDVGHDFRHRLCDQQTSGGGWTVNAITNFRLCFGLTLLYKVLLFDLM